ncbi:MAG: cob(I)yrinic acid a,c-diamide adenosyltransferase [Candidatus ainarchaeum sp.]|nr:cob(I)yrinic acid a,c-diamide adenosyltransferase [Candidatus ainarchaeum sp.]
MIIYYYGTGKGKTTAGLGALVRAKAYNKKILLIQSLKNNPVESKLFNGFCFGDSSFINKTPEKKHYSFAQDAFDFFKEQKGKYDVIMFDELSILLHYGLLDVEQVVESLSEFVGPEYPVLIITGRYKIKGLEEVADIVTEMKEKKHIYKKGIKALKGIDY